MIDLASLMLRQNLPDSQRNDRSTLLLLGYNGDPSILVSEGGIPFDGLVII
jgi:hypothetical protein